MGVIGGRGGYRYDWKTDECGCDWKSTSVGVIGKRTSGGQLLSAVCLYVVMSFVVAKLPFLSNRYFCQQCLL